MGFERTSPLHNHVEAKMLTRCKRALSPAWLTVIVTLGLACVSGCGDNLSSPSFGCADDECEPPEDAHEPAPEADIPEPAPETDGCAVGSWCAWEVACEGLDDAMILPNAPLCGYREGLCEGARRSCGDSDPELDCALATYQAQALAPVDPGGEDLYCDGLDNACIGVVDPNCCGPEQLDSWWQAQWPSVGQCVDRAMMPLAAGSGDGFRTDVSLFAQGILGQDGASEAIRAPWVEARVYEPSSAAPLRSDLLHEQLGGSMMVMDSSLPQAWLLFTGRILPSGLTLTYSGVELDGRFVQSLRLLQGWPPTESQGLFHPWVGLQSEPEAKTWIWFRSGDEAALILADRDSGVVSLVANGAHFEPPQTVDVRPDEPATPGAELWLNEPRSMPWLFVNEEMGLVHACVLLAGPGSEDGSTVDDYIGCERWALEGSRLELVQRAQHPLGYHSVDLNLFGNVPPELPLSYVFPSRAGQSAIALHMDDFSMSFTELDDSAGLVRRERGQLANGEEVFVQTRAGVGGNRIELIRAPSGVPGLADEVLWSVSRGAVDGDGWSVTTDGVRSYVGVLRWQDTSCFGAVAGQLPKIGQELRYLPLSADGWPWCEASVETVAESAR